MNALHFVFFATMQIIVSARPGIVEMEDTSQSKFVDFNTLSKQALQFKCKPQPRAFLAKEYLSEPLEASEKLLVHNIILYRCDQQSGCCLRDNEVCGEQKSEPVTIQIKVKDSLTGKEKFITTKNTFNHTSCQCGPINSQPKRDNIDARVESLTSSTGLTIFSNTNNVAFLFSSIYLLCFHLF